MLLFEASSETGRFRHLPAYVFGVCNFKNAKSMRVIFFEKCLKLNLDFQNPAKNWEKVLCFWDNCIRTGIVKLFLLRTRFFSSAANAFTRSPKILLVNKRDFFQVNWLGSNQSIWQRHCHADFICPWVRFSCCFSKSRLKQDFLDIYLTTLLESVISEIQKLWGSSLFSKWSKFKVYFKNTSKSQEKDFCFWVIAFGLVLLICLY